MSIDISLPPQVSQAKAPVARRWGWKPGLAILGFAAAIVVYLQTVGVIDNGISNIATMVTLALAFVLLNLWLGFFAPLSGTKRILGVASLLGLLAVAVGLVRVDGFTGNMRPRFVWRWTPNAEALIAAKSLDEGRKLVTGADAVANSSIDPNQDASVSTSASVGGKKNAFASIDVGPTDHDFPGFLGPHRNAYVPGIKLATDWQVYPPKLIWRQPIGIGYSGFALVGDAAITLEQRAEKELVTCYNLKTGELVWHHEILARHHDAVGGDGPESTPTVFEGKVYALGGTGVLRCLDAATGQQIWLRDVLADVGTDYETDRKGVAWGRSASPLVVDDLVVVPAGGPPEGPKVSLIAYNRLTGEKVWTGGNRQVSYSSPSLATYGGVRQIVIVNEDTISSHDPQTGTVLWETPWDGSSNSTATASQSIQVADDQLLVSKGYSGGAQSLSVKCESDKKPEDGQSKLQGNGEWTIGKVWQNHGVLKTKQNNVIVKDDCIYGLSDGVMQCVDLKTGKLRWRGADYGHGQLLRIGDVLLVLGEEGEVALVEFNPVEFVELAKFQALHDKTWNNPAVSGNLLVIRNAKEAACYELPLAK